MAKKSRLIPFRFMPAAWGLDGDSYKKAEIEYYYDGYERERKLAEIDYADRPKTLKLRLAEIDLKYGKVKDGEVEKLKASLKGEPYVSMTTTYDHRYGVNGVFFQGDWNQEWIDLLRENDYVGATDDDVMTDWFNHLCASIAEAAVETAVGEVVNEQGQSRTRRVLREDGTVEHS